MKYAFDGTRYLSPETRLRAEMRKLTEPRWLETHTTTRIDRLLRRPPKQRLRVVRV